MSAVASVQSAPVRVQGAVKWFDPKKGYGFIKPSAPVGNSKGDVFLHSVQLRKSSVDEDTLLPGTVLEFELQPGSNGKGPQAINVRVMA